MKHYFFIFSGLYKYVKTVQVLLQKGENEGFTYLYLTMIHIDVF